MKRAPSTRARLRAAIAKELARPASHPFCRIAGVLKKRSKYGNQVTWVGDVRFDSKREARYYEELLLRFRARALIFRPLRQVPFHLPGGVRYVVDFLFVDRDGIHFVDVKGHRTSTYKLKKKQVEDLYRVCIEEA